MAKMSSVAGVLIALAALSSPCGAHEIGKTLVTATFPSSGTYQVDIVVDPDALLTRLAVLRGEPLPGALSRAERDRRIAAMGHAFSDAMIIDFDGAPARPQFEYRPASA